LQERRIGSALHCLDVVNFNSGGIDYDLRHFRDGPCAPYLTLQGRRISRPQSAKLVNQHAANV
jgi:hypothetical protein